MNTQEDTSMDINQIMSIIPHRYPFLLIDRIKEIILGESIIGIKNVTFNEPQFTGHFPSRPIMPGVLIIEAMAQLSAVLVAKSMETTEDKEVFFMSIEESKFRKIVEPGDCLVMYSSIVQNRSSVWKFKARAEVDGKIASEAVFTAMVRDKNKG
ncbi:MAG: 3-hydroxyacyl-ACP dehydratase FabZ [Candidatus Megaira endosymbiont of Mesostigma viride]|jgi:3-hydroxyacyl-[acyl-carrier-protein] dehydratase|nr:MAG: 3-hydroxyacyl-ACP dehydratase FabZ [Candidatus Megaira endosymbiont of Mesostigma viride]HJK88751.1 3-hydroxyacyl-ACP dehydratase FabZ [Candidatus Megaira endosymbiont of Mesostigma viride]